jgi:hypothetical protein
MAALVGDLVGYVDPAGRDVFHMITVDYMSDGTANSVLSIAPAIRRSPAAGTAINYTNPKAIWRLASDDQGLEYERGVFAAAVLTIEEAIF